MNIGVIVLIVIVAWSAVSVVVALAVGGMARSRDEGATPVLDHAAAAGRMSPPARDEQVRTAV